MDGQELEIGLKEHQQIMLQILNDFANFCDEHNLRYYLDAGTLLGAVRHQGFIPWDNDADVCMMRADYDRFVDLIKNGVKINDHLVLELPEDTIYTFLKIGDTRTRLIEFPDTAPEECFVYIDVFPKDGIRELGWWDAVVCKLSGTLALIHWFNKHSIRHWQKTKHGTAKMFAKAMDLLVLDKNIGYKLQNRLIRAYRKHNPLDNCKYLTTLVNGEFNGCCDKKCWEESTMLMFCNREFRVPKGYDLWLRTLYGEDYMILPSPENQRVHRVDVLVRKES